MGETPLVQLSGNKHCGLLKQNRFKFEVWITGQTLDSNGFLADNAIIGQWFDRLTETAESCELICQRAANDFLKSDITVEKVKVRIWGIRDQAFAEVEATRNDV
jgi:hypothetical protein